MSRTGLRSVTFSPIPCGQDRTTSTESMRGSRPRTRASISSVSMPTSGAPTGTAAAARTCSGVSTSVPAAVTFSTRSQEEP